MSLRPMRAADTFTKGLFTMRNLEDFVPVDLPLRTIRVMANAARAKLGPLFVGLYKAEAKGG